MITISDLELNDTAATRTASIKNVALSSSAYFPQPASAGFAPLAPNSFGGAYLRHHLRPNLHHRRHERREILVDAAVVGDCHPDAVLAV